ncbi:3-hydroxyacyl-CoA dehydrogenase NAD-binding domain-containing protein [Thalassorhabdomicrobium marinisediminis]|uniref:enoyl-CoA hydratase n=1 Tax=Thalassorhabdomicrobium marinisediminis TaxID=2170577 RepID=A0A2T7FTQ4_9RHOB|nr:3-hydroxyacyl-CoA dehydrogenase NAD-binding domain-containing protein [Thalassorhabdomicrobium marinisediminis]PVA05522.1 fatty-acid oxidation protein subunit alpha [Thalassorhabdomicrobium marinisediminis]
MTGRVLSHLGETRLELGPVEPGPGPWRSARDADNVLWLVLDVDGSSMNTISEEVIRALDSALQDAEADLPKAVVIRSGKVAGFAAGADITGFEKMSSTGATEMLQEAHRVLDRLEALDCPTICVVHGAALGAGFEIALACDYRIATPGASFGLPEVQLGLHPGLGGTFRLPALIGPTEAMTLMLTGKTAHTKRAKSLGIADLVVEERHIAAAIASVIDGEVKPAASGFTARAFGFDPARSLAARKIRSETEKKAPAKHYPAPHALIDLWEEYGDDRDRLQKAETDSFALLLRSEASRNLRRAFFLRQGLKDAGRGEDGITHVHVIGAGSMGTEIAAMAAIRGKQVSLGDLSEEALGQAVKRTAEICKDKHLDSLETRDALDRLMPDPNGYGLAQADLVIEAASEDAEVKAKIFKGLKGKLKKDAIVATNTSSLSVDDLAANAPAKSRFAGLHFFNPVSKIDLVEVVRGTATSDKTVQRLAAFCGAIGKLPARVADSPGFVVNRMLVPYMLEAMVLMDEGVSKEVIDTAALRFGMPMGPVTLADQVGLDIGLHVAESLSDSLETKMPPISDDLKRRVEAGDLGKKTGKGFYDWSKGTPHPDADLEDAPDDLRDRLILPMLNAGAEGLRRNVAKSADQIDAAMIFGTGWAPFRGGPMCYAQTRGIDDVVRRLRELEAAHGPRFAPDDGWSRFA